MRVVSSPRSLCAVDGSLFIPTVKASLIHIVEAAKSEPCVPDLPPDDIADDALRDLALVIDAMPVLQNMKKAATMHTLADLKEAYKIFDHYLEQLKNKTRQKREVTSIEYEVHPELKLSMPLKELLSSYKIKSSLTAYLAESLLAHSTTVLLAV